MYTIYEQRQEERNEINEDMANAIREKWNEGLFMREIARELHIPEATVRKVLRG
jgi:DNA-binding transcriptional regulator LsrR (DeoR family)